ncbi:hypothetical protein ACSSS7_002448 [Eimeria intestinalis]
MIVLLLLLGAKRHPPHRLPRRRRERKACKPHSNKSTPPATSANNEADTIVHKCVGILDSSQSIEDFGALHLDRRLLRVLIDVLQLEHPTHVQAQVVPLALEGRDLVVEGRTGSGKTLAYVLPLLQRLLRLHATGHTTLTPLSGIILVYQVLTVMLKYTSDIVTVSHTAHLQGSTKEPSRAQVLVPPTVMVGTPTGMLQYLDRLRLRQHHMDLLLSLQILVVDEADLLFAFGFEKDTKRLVERLPSTAARHYQTILVSATQNQELAQLQSLMLHKPLLVRIEEKDEQRGDSGSSAASSSVGEFYFQAPTEAEKWLVAYAFLRLGLVPLKCLVFCKDVANMWLPVDATPAVELHQERVPRVQAFNQGLVDILITSDGQDEVDEEDESAQRIKTPYASGKPEAAEQRQQTFRKRSSETPRRVVFFVDSCICYVDLFCYECMWRRHFPTSLEARELMLQLALSGTSQMRANRQRRRSSLDTEV